MTTQTHRNTTIDPKFTFAPSQTSFPHILLCAISSPINSYNINKYTVTYWPLSISKLASSPFAFLTIYPYLSIRALRTVRGAHDVSYKNTCPMNDFTFWITIRLPFSAVMEEAVHTQTMPSQIFLNGLLFAGRKCLFIWVISSWALIQKSISGEIGCILFLAMNGVYILFAYLK